MMLHPRTLAKIPKMIPLALAGDPSAIAFLAFVGAVAAVNYIKENR